MQKVSRFLPVTLSALALALLMPATPAAAAAVVYGTSGFLYEQNFDTLASSGSNNAWTNGTTITGWHGVIDSTAFTDYTATSDPGAAATNRLRSLGSDAADRALGAQNGNDPQDIYYGLQLSNDTGFTLNSFTLTYTGEQWRMISGENADGLSFSYQIFATGMGSLTAATPWTNVSALDFTAPSTTTGGSTGLDGNLEANRVEDINSTVSGITWGNGQELWLRWNDNNPGSTDYQRAAMGIDDVSFTAVPEPSSALMVGLGTVLLGLRRRR